MSRFGGLAEARYGTGFLRGASAVLRMRMTGDEAADAAKAREFGAEGIGLCRTEHMFFDAERVQAVREMILARDTAARERALGERSVAYVGLVGVRCRLRGCRGVRLRKGGHAWESLPEWRAHTPLARRTDRRASPPKQEIKR